MSSTQADGHKYKMGKQLWYIQDRAKDAIKAGKPVAGQPSTRPNDPTLHQPAVTDGPIVARWQ